MKICWLTGSSFIDVDISLVKDMKYKADLFWIVILQRESFYSYEYIESFMKQNNIRGLIVVFNQRLRSIKTLWQYFNTVCKMKALKADVYYIDYLGLPYMFPLIHICRLQKNKVIYPCHDFIDHVFIPHRKQISNYKRFIFKHFTNIQFFSSTQKKMFEEKYKNKKTFFIPLNLKSFGDTVKIAGTEKIVFLFFGMIRKNKGLEVLLNAVNLIEKKYRDKFIIKIYGNTSDWFFYENLIRDKSLYDLQIRRIENDEIPDLFATSHFLILPYYDVTQSGPLLIAYNYRLPVIASDLPGFREYIENKKNGYLFKVGEPVALAATLSQIIASYPSDYNLIKKNLCEFVDQNISQEILLQKYINMFEEVIHA